MYCIEESASNVFGISAPGALLTLAPPRYTSEHVFEYK